MADVFVGDTGNSATNGTNLQSALNAANPGDNIILTAGAVYDGPFNLPDRSAVNGQPITVKGTASLPEGRISPAYASSMPRCRSNGLGGIQGGVFELAANAGWWVLDGLEMVDNTSTSDTIPTMVDGVTAGCHDLTVQRCYIHNKQVAPDYFRNIRFGIQFEGSGCTVKWCHIDIQGYYKSSEPAYIMIDSNCFISVGGSNITLEDNYLSSWYVEYFLGGGDTAPQNTANVTSSSTTSGTFDNVTGLAAGIIMRCDFAMVGTWNTSTNVFTRTSGATMTSADIDRRGTLTQGSLTGIYRITAVAGSDYTMVCDAGNPSIPSGAVTHVVYEMARVNSVAGSVVNYTPFGMRSLQQAPSVAKWCYGMQGLVANVTVRGNLFYKDPLFAVDAFAHTGNNPKGYFEIKHCANLLVENNRFDGWPACSLAWTASNQNGTAPWCTCKDVVFKNNWVNMFSAIIISDNQYTDTNTPAKNFLFYNNLLKGSRNWFQGGSSVGTPIETPDAGANANVRAIHNTIINDGSFSGGYNGVTGGLGVMPNHAFVDNIVNYMGNGLMCFFGDFAQSTCWPSGDFRNNAVIDTQAVGFNANWWGVGSILTPIQTSFEAIGFTSLAAGDYRLLASSPYYHAATDGKDPGVDWNEFNNAQQEDTSIILLGRGIT